MQEIYDELKYCLQLQFSCDKKEQEKVQRKAEANGTQRIIK